MRDVGVEPVGVSPAPPDFVKIADAYGIAAERLASPAGLPDALRRGRAAQTSLSHRDHGGLSRWRGGVSRQDGGGDGRHRRAWRRRARQAARRGRHLPRADQPCGRTEGICLRQARARHALGQCRTRRCRLRRGLLRDHPGPVGLDPLRRRLRDVAAWPTRLGRFGRHLCRHDGRQRANRLPVLPRRGARDARIRHGRPHRQRHRAAGPRCRARAPACRPMPRARRRSRP